MGDFLYFKIYGRMKNATLLVIDPQTDFEMPF